MALARQRGLALRAVSDLSVSSRELRRLAALEMVAPMSERRARMSVLVVEIRRMLDESDPDGRDGALVRRQEMDPLSAAVLLEHEVKRVGR